MSDAGPAGAKRALRRTMRAIRAGCDPALGERLADHVMQASVVPSGAIVSGFLPLPGEIDIIPLLLGLVALGVTLALPVTPPPGNPLIFRHWQPGAPLLLETYGTWAPIGRVLTPQVLLVPLLAFDRRGFRLGYGGGYYDRTLPLLPGALTIGCGFAAQELDEVPVGPYDARLAMIATERGVIDCRLHET